MLKTFEQTIKSKKIITKDYRTFAIVFFVDFLYFFVIKKRINKWRTYSGISPYIDYEVMCLYEVKIFIEDKEVQKIDDEQRKAILERAFSSFYKKDAKAVCAK